MCAQSTGEQPISISVLNDITLVQAARCKTARHDVRPDVDVLFGVGDDNRLAGSARRGMQAHDLLHGAGKQTEGIGVAQIGLDGKRQMSDIL